MSLDLVDTVGLTRGADVVHAVATHCVFRSLPRVMTRPRCGIGPELDKQRIHQWRACRCSAIRQSIMVRM